MADIGHYSTATEMLRALNAREISSRELVELHLKRIDAVDGALNAIPVRTPERALEAAERADKAMPAGDKLALQGLPMTLKESTKTAGLPQTAGLLDFKDFRPATDGPIAAGVLAAGACLLGKTNIPVSLTDWQADSPVYGRTNNPWDLARTPGGSTGGGAAALAAGMTPLEIGSDIGGSIRVPAAYCGVYGHRPSTSAVPRTGAFPLADYANPGAVMGVQGPLARSASDLELLFDVIAVPSPGEEIAWQLTIPAARHDTLSQFRVAVMPVLPWVQPANELQGRVEELASFLDRHGATVKEAMPSLDVDQYFRDYLALLMLETSAGMSLEERAQRASRAASDDSVLGAIADGFLMGAAEHLGLLRRREIAREAWRSFFSEWDVVIAPAVLDAAFPHQDGPQEERVLGVDGTEVPYMMNVVYSMWAIFAGLPSTAFPGGLNGAGLPLGLQAIGPYLEDRTTLRFAQLLEREWQGFQAPPGY
jgi:amidase